MAFEAGTRFGAYEIVEAIGAGGMGEVWRARDTTLERDVAIKVLPESFASDADRVARFEQEAKTLASLNHPNIAHVHGLEKSDGTTAIVMELVEGPTLANRIELGPLPADEALNIALQIAKALEAAHERGIVHRDLKPANIKLKDDGTVKVLDFGIAKALSPELSTDAPSPIMTTPVTQIGVILGTAAYMSPEQARGRPVDQRTDIWAFGCLLYEMLTGQLAFSGEDVAVIMARVIANDTDMDSLPGMISPAVRHTIGLCLKKDPSERIADIRDVRLALKGAFETGAAAAADRRAAPPSALRRTIPIAAALVAGIGLTALGLRFTGTVEPAPVNRFDFDVTADLAPRNQGRAVMALSPDGRAFVLNTARGLYLRRMDELEARPIPGTEELLTNPFFSPDGQSVGYFATSGDFKRISISGGAPVVIASNLNNPLGASWTSDGWILAGQIEGIVRFPATGGTPELVFPAGEQEQLDGPQLLPDGDSVLFSATQTDSWDTAEIVVGSLATGERTTVLRGGSDARYLPSGHLVYAYEDNLYAIAFDLDTLSVSGGPVSLVQGLSRAAASLTASANYGIAENGTLTYFSGGLILFNANFSLVWKDLAGNETAVNMPACSCVDIALSPDGTRVAMEDLGGNAATGGDIWIWSFDAETRTRLTVEPGFQDTAVWSPDSRRITYQSTGEGVMSRAADGTGAVEQLLNTQMSYPYSLDQDGNIIFGVGHQDIHVLNVSGDGSDEPLLASEFVEDRPALSPDGNWLAYESDETGIKEIYVRPYPDVDSGKQKVSNGGGMQAKWSADGSRLYYMSPTYLMMAEVETDPTFSRKTTEQLFSLDGFRVDDQEDRTYDVSADGQHFLMLKAENTGSGTAQAKIIIVENWTNELERQVPTN